MAETSDERPTRINTMSNAGVIILIIFVLLVIFLFYYLRSFFFFYSKLTFKLFVRIIIFKAFAN